MMTASLCNQFRTLLFKFTSRLPAEDGQDLVEYALVIAFLSFCAIAAEQNVATSISGAFMNIANAFNGEV